MIYVNEIISLIIDNIKYSGFASIEYWIIVFTDKAVYFCNTKSNYGYGIFGAIADTFHNNRAKGETDINSILSRSKRYYRFEKERFASISFKKGLIKNKIIIDTGKIKIKIKINSTKYNQFIEQIKIFK